MIASASQKQQVQKRATAPRPTGNTVVRASAARAAGRAAAAAATRKMMMSTTSTTSAGGGGASDEEEERKKKRALVAQLKDLAAAFGAIAQKADMLRGLAAAVQLPNGVTLIDVAAAVDDAVERAERAAARVERPRSPSCYSPNSPEEAPSSPDYAPAYTTDYYHHCAYEYRPDCACKGCVDARGKQKGASSSSSLTYAPSSPDVHECDNADCACVGCAAVRAAHSPRYTPTTPVNNDCASPCYAPTSPNWYHCPNGYMDGCTCVGCR